MVQVSSVNQLNPVSVSPSTGTTDHDKLTNRDLTNQHPIKAITGLREALSDNETSINTHIADKNNPHEVSKAQVGLGNCDNTSDLNKPISTATQSALNLKVDTADLGNAELDIQKNGTSVGKFTANASTDKVINIVVPTKASDVNALPDSTKYGASLSLSINSSTFVVTAQLKDQDGGNLGSAQTIDLPLESVVVNGTYDSINKKIVLTLENGNTVDIPVGDLIAGLQSEITVDNKLSADLVDDSSANHKFVTASEKSQITTNANNIVDLQNNKASTSLDNLSADGQMVIDTQNGTISNCVLEIPQSLKLEFSNGAVTLKAGSIITRTGSTYSTLTTTQDITWGSSSQANKKMYIFASNSGNPVGLYNNVTLEKVGSGDILPANGDTYSNFYLTTDKIIYSWSNGSWQASNLAYPLAIIETEENGNITGFAKDSNGNYMIFNGAGFIGHHAFIYPNVKVLIPDGLNADGSLKSTEYTLNSLNIEEISLSYPNIFIKNFGSSNTLKVRGYHIVNTYDEINIQSFHHYYVKSENKMYRAMSSTTLSEYGSVNIVNVGFNGTTVTDFTIRQPVRTATVEMLDTLQDQVDTNTTAIAGKQADVTTITGYDATKTQTLKNVNGVLTWVDD